MSTTVIVLIVVAVVVIVVLWFIKIQNKLVNLDELCKNALKQINVQQISRYDAIKALVKLTREYAQYEGDTLTNVIQARGGIKSSPNPSADDINANEQLLAEITTRIMAVAEQYPTLKANETYLTTMNDIKKYEENVRLSRMTCNDTITRYNRQVRTFPDSIVASTLHFPVRDYLKDDLSKVEYPEI